MKSNRNPALDDPYPVRTERDVAMYRETKDAKRGRRATVSSPEKSEYDEIEKSTIVTAPTRPAQSIEAA